MNKEDAIGVLEELFAKEDNNYYSSRIGDVQVFIEELQAEMDFLRSENKKIINLLNNNNRDITRINNLAKSMDIPPLDLAKKETNETLESLRWRSVIDELPKIGQKVLLLIDGKVKENMYIYDMADTNDYGGMSYFWSRDDLEVSPEVKESDMWQPWPMAPKENKWN